MNTGLGFNITANDREFLNALNRSGRAVNTFSNNVISEGDRIELMFNKMQRAAGMFGISLGAKELISNIVQVRNQFQQLEIAFGTMLKSTDKAKQLMSELQTFAANTPFGLQSASSGAKQLIAYGSKAEDVIKELTMLGDVAAGTGQQIGDLVYLYGTLRMQGRAYLMDIRQFAGRGIPIYAELAKVLGVAEGKVNELVSAGKVGFPEVEQAFKNMTTAGGMYGGLMAEQSKSIGGRWEELKDNIDAAFNSIGKSSEGIIYSSIDGLNLLVANYEKLGKILLALVVTYGAYRAAVMLCAAAENIRYQATLAQMAGMTKMQAITDVLRVKTAALNATLLANPYVAVTVVVVGLVAAMWALRDSTTGAEKAQAELNKRKEEAAQKEEEHRNEIEKLITASTNQALADLERTDALEKLKQKYPQIFAKYDIETLKLADILSIKKQIAEIDAGEKVKSNKSGYEKAKSDASIATNNYNRLKNTNAAWQGYDIALSDAKNKMDYANKILDDYESKVQNDRINSFISGINKMTDTQIKAELAARQRLQAEMQHNDVKSGTTKGGVLDGEFNTDQIKQQTDALTSELNKRKVPVKSYIEWEKQYNSDLKGLQNERKKIEQNNSKLSEADLKKQLDDVDSKIKAKKDEIKTLTGKTKDTSKADESKAKKAKELANDEAELRKKLANEALQAELDHEQAILDAKEDSYKKQFQLNDLNYRKELQKIKEYNDQKLKEQADFITKFGKKALPEELTDKSIKEQVSKKTNQAQYNYEAADSKTEKQRLEADQQAWNEYLKTYGDYEDKRLAIFNEYREKIGKAQTLGEKALLAGNRDKELQDLDQTLIEKSDLWVRLFDDASKHTTGYITETIKKVQQLIDYMKGVKGVEIPIGFTPEQIESLKKDPEKVKEILKGLKTQVDELNTRNPFNSLIQGFKDLKKAGKDTEKQYTATNKIISGIQGVREVVGQLSTAFTDLGMNSEDSLAKVMNVMDRTASMAQTGAQIGGAWGAAIGGAIGLTTSLISAFKGKSKAQKDTEQLQDVTSKIETTNNSINRLLEKRIDLINEATAAEAGYLNTLTQEQIKQQQTYVQSMFDRLSGNEIFGKKGKNNNLSLSALMQKEGLSSMEEFVEWWNSNGVNKLIGEGYDLKNEDQWQSIVDSWEELSEAAENAEKAMKEAVTGISFDSLKDSLDDLVKSADTTFEDIGDSFNDHMRTAALKFAKSSYLTKALQDWYDKFAEYAQSGSTDDSFGLTPEETAELRKMYEDAYNKAQGLYDSALDAMGISKEDSDINGITGVAASITQDSANELNGNFYAVRQSLNDVRNINKQTQEYIKVQTGHISDVKEAVSSYKQVFADQLEYQKQIAENTAATASILRDIRDKGIDLRR